MSEDSSRSRYIPSTNYRCRKCRFVLFCDKDLNSKHKRVLDCSAWYLDDDDILPWIESLINESGWTEGKLYCPKCQARVGAFDFVHVIQCTCKENVVPAIWCTKGKIDNIGKMKLSTTRFSDSEYQDKSGFQEGSHSPSGANSSHKDQSLSYNLGSGQSGDTGSTSNSINSTRMMKKESRIRPSNVCFGAQDRIKGNPRNHETMFCHSPVSSRKSCIAIANYHDDTARANKQTTYHKVQRGPLMIDICSGERDLYDNQSVHEQLDFKDDTQCVGRHMCERELTCRTVTSKEGNLSPNTACCHQCLQNPSKFRVSCGHHLHRDLEEIREEIVHLYKKVVESDMETPTGRRHRKTRRCKRSVRNQGCRVYSQDCCSYYDNTSTLNRTHRRRIIDPPKTSTDSVSVERRVIPDEHQCSVCLELFIDPHMTPCEHTFCALCLRQLNQASERKPTCPLCRAPVMKVSPNKELKEEIVKKYPKIYKKREGEIRVHPHTRLPLPSPTSTRFQFQHGNENGQNGIMLFLHSFGVAILITLITVVFGFFGDDRNQRSLINFRNSALFKLFKLLLILTAVCSCVAVGVMLASIVFYAFDFVKFASFIILCYLVIMKVMIVVVSN